MEQNVLVLDPAGRIVWANHRAHTSVNLPPGALLGRNYLEFCPPETHSRLLELHRRKMAGEIVTFTLAVGREDFRITSGPIRVGERLYLYVVGVPARRRPNADAGFVGALAVGEALPDPPLPLDLNSLLLHVLKQDAAALKGRLSLVPGRPPLVRGRAWPLGVVLRRLIADALPARGRLELSTGGNPRSGWIRLSARRLRMPPAADLKLCRRVLKDHRGTLTSRKGLLTLRLPTA